MSVLETDALPQSHTAPQTNTAPSLTVSKVASASAVLRDLLIVTWAAPATAVQALVPPGTILERLPSSEGELLGFVQLVFALREDARWSPLPSQLGEDYHEATLQVLTRTETGPAATVVKHLVSSSQVATSLLPFSRVVEDARFHVYVAGDPARQTFERMGAKLTTHAVQVHVRAEACEVPTQTIFGSWSQSVAFVSRLAQQWHPARLPKESQNLFRTEHTPLAPVAAKLTHQIVRPFDALELGEPILALYQAELPVKNPPIKRR